MITYSTYGFYTTEYGGKLDASVYKRIAPTAKAEIDRLTFNHAATAPDSMAENLSWCECYMIDAINGFNSVAEILPAGVGSVSNDGYSISRGGLNGQSTEDAETQAKRDIAQKWLRYPVNLLYRGVDHVCHL